jgi:hypothetical protein
MRAAGQFDDRALPAAQRFDVGQVLADRCLVALPLIQFVPLVVIVKDERDDLEEIFDDPASARASLSPVKDRRHLRGASGCSTRGNGIMMCRS